MELSNKDIQRIRTMSYFVEATQQIIESEGIDAVTIRKVSKLAGYNPATLYNYFDNLDYLVGFASIKYLQDYHQSLKNEVESIEDPYERFLAIWEKFCLYSFEKPKIYRALFFKTPKFSLCDMFEFYYKMFPGELGEHIVDIQQMMQGCRLHSRNMFVLLRAVESEDKTLSGSQLNQMNDMMIGLYRGKLSECIEDEWSPEDQKHEVRKMLQYIKNLYHMFG